MNRNVAHWEQQFTAYLLGQDIHEDGAHDMGHLRRVYKTATRINEAEGVAEASGKGTGWTGAEAPGKAGDPLVLLAACYFHDLVSLPKNHPDRSHSSRLSAEATGKLLREHFSGFPPDKIEGVQHAILTHSFSASIPPQTLEAKILQDADRMEALGAIGIARTFYTAGVMHSRMFHETDPLGLHRELNDREYSLDHFQVKLLQLPAMMQTVAGKKMAEERAALLIAFREQMVREILGE
jgi:uncharacterized protein